MTHGPDSSVITLKVFGKAHKATSAAENIRFKCVDTLDCIQGLASGRFEKCEGYTLYKDRIPSLLKEVIPGTVMPSLVVAPPSRRDIARDLAASMANLYDCPDITHLFKKRDYNCLAGKGLASEDLARNLCCASGLDIIKDGSLILIVDDVVSTETTFNAMRLFLTRAAKASDLRFEYAAILRVQGSNQQLMPATFESVTPTPSPSAPAR